MNSNLKNKIKDVIIKKGKFNLKDGTKSRIYFDFRELISSPPLMDEITDEISFLVKEFAPDLLVALPYGSLPITSVVSVKTGIPFIYKRKEKKAYGTQNELEGRYKQGQSCLIIDDVITSGGSKEETIRYLKRIGLKPIGIIVIVDRRKKVEELFGLKVTSLFKELDFDN
ncbi:MAG: orotate phosphoribosyltransferase [Patescibacteria group bacterium]|nr:orotate phosphoribosyltransferase [Patescibacteria group bacterium]